MSRSYGIAFIACSSLHFFCGCFLRGLVSFANSPIEYESFYKQVYLPPKMGPKSVLPLGVNLRVMEMNGALHTLHSYKTGASPSDAVWCNTQDTPFLLGGIISLKGIHSANSKPQQQDDRWRLCRTNETNTHTFFFINIAYKNPPPKFLKIASR